MTVIYFILGGACMITIIYLIISYFKNKHANAVDDVTTISTTPPITSPGAPVIDTVSSQEPVKKALLVGINHYDPSVGAEDLNGCVNDVKNMKALLTGDFGFDASYIKILTDSNATQRNILNGLYWLLNNNAEGSELVFHYSGHGSQVPDMNGDETDDYMDEIICPYDLNWDDPLSDDVLAKLFKQVPAGVYLTMISDSCHSGTIDRDISRRRHIKKFIEAPTNIRDKSKGKKLIRNRFGKKDVGVQGHILVSGCKDDQTSEDAYINGVHQGAFTWALTTAIKSNLNFTWTQAYAETLKNMQIAGIIDQTPQLSGNATLEARHVFGGAV